MKKTTAVRVLVLMLVVSMVFGLTACGGKKTDEPGSNQGATNVTFSGVEAISVSELSEFDPLAGVTAKGENGEDFTSEITVSGSVDTLTVGEYTLTYTVKGTSVKRTVSVTGVEATPANGVFNYKFADSDTRHAFMAAAENYLLQTQAAGVPLFSDALYQLFSPRVQLVSEESLPVMGFGVMYSSLTADDSKVLMEDGKPGKEGEYTYRQALTGNPSYWNHWIYDDQTSSDVMTHYIGKLYEYEFNADKTGYVLVPSMAAADPIPVDSRFLPSGKEVSNKWQIKISDNLKWKFNSNTDTSMITKTTIDAKDFYETYKIALENKWLRAVSGGGDFVGGPQKVVNAQAFVDGTAQWEDVGIKLIDDYTLEFHFVEAQSEWNVKYGFGGFVNSPINIELYNALGDKYGVDEKSIAYTGPFYVDYFECDKIIRLKKNELFHDADKFFYTGRTFPIIADAEMRFQEFLAGKLDTTALPTAHFEDYKSHPGLKRVPGATTYRMMINGLGTKDDQLAQFPESTWEPEAILANQDFKMAMFHAIDRKKLAEEVLKTSQAQMYLFTNAYVVEAELGIPYRDTPQGQTVGADLSPSTFGYNIDAARAYYEKALTKLFEDGVYKSGDTIEVEFYFFSGSDAQELMAAYLKDAFESAFKTDKFDITFTFTAMAKDFPGIYYNHMMIGEFDTAIGGISGSALDAAAFLDTYCSDNRGYFTLNWGIDTSLPVIPVTYTNDSGDVVKELWSFDAIAMVLVGEVEVVNGAEKTE